MCVVVARKWCVVKLGTLSLVSLLLLSCSLSLALALVLSLSLLLFSSLLTTKHCFKNRSTYKFRGVRV